MSLPFSPGVLEQLIGFHNVILQIDFGLQVSGVGLDQMPQFGYRCAAIPNSRAKVATLSPFNCQER
jgi:hypothetical protein